MTFEKLKELIEKYNIPNNVKLINDNGWERDETEMDGIYYNEKENQIIFTPKLNDEIKMYFKIYKKNYKELKENE